MFLTTISLSATAVSVGAGSDEECIGRKRQRQKTALMKTKKAPHLGLFFWSEKRVRGSILLVFVYQHSMIINRICCEIS